MITSQGKIKEPTSWAEASYTVFGFCFIGVRHAYVIAGNTRLRFRWYRLRLHRFFLQEHRSPRLRRHRRLRCFLHRLGRLLRLRHRTSSRWLVWVIRREKRNLKIPARVK